MLQGDWSSDVCSSDLSLWGGLGEGLRRATLLFFWGKRQRSYHHATNQASNSRTRVFAIYNRGNVNRALRSIEIRVDRDCYCMTLLAHGCGIHMLTYDR